MEVLVNGKSINNNNGISTYLQTEYHGNEGKLELNKKLILLRLNPRTFL